MARLYGGGTWYLIRTHIGHELWPLLTINALAVVGRAILQESSLAFLGLSDPLARSWGYDDRPGRGLPRSLPDGLLDVVAPPAGGGAGAVHAAAAPAGGRAGGTTEEGQAVLLEVNNLSVSYPEFTLHPVSFALDAGEMLTIVGSRAAARPPWPAPSPACPSRRPRSAGRCTSTAGSCWPWTSGRADPCA